MPSFSKTPDAYGPFGRNQYLRSTVGCKFESYTVAASTVPDETIGGYPVKILQPGEVMAKITSGAEAGKVGPYSNDTVGVTDGRSDLANVVGINDSFLPWQLMEADREIGVNYDCTAVQGWCFERNAAGARIALTDATATAMVAKKTMSISFQA